VSRHPSVGSIVRYFDVSHYQRRDAPYEVATAVKLLVEDVLEKIPDDSPELTAGLRKLLEAKDALVRAALDTERPSWTDR